MIAYLKGTLISKSPDNIIIDVHGVGYNLIISLPTFYTLPDIGEQVELNVYTHVREDIISLYGFYSIKEKKIFNLLTSISKIGPKLARNIISGIAVDDLIEAIADEEVDKLSSIPGIGNKTANRLVLELKDKVEKISAQVGLKDIVKQEETKNELGYPLLFEDALSALINLGYRKNNAEVIVKKVMKELGGRISLEQLIKISLGKLSGKNIF
ncbi:MAG: Holliday junction branch migration protein RuvA [bacterium]